MASGDFLAKIKLALEGKDTVVSGLKQTQQVAMQLSKMKVTSLYDKDGIVKGQKIQEVFSKMKPAAAESARAIGDFEKALRRVIVVAPVWMAFRGILQGVISTLKDGFRTWEEFDRQLIKSKAVIHGYSGDSSEALKVLENRIREFSKESGIAVADLTSAFYRFGTVGIVFESAMSGAIASAKLAKATLGDTDTIARTLAMTYRLLGDTIDSTLSPMQQQEQLAGKIFHLWKTNAFESNEFAQSLNNFVSSANIANFTADQTVATLAALGTAGVQGSRGGTLLKTAIQKLVENLDKLAPKLGLAVNPELENTFSLFMRVLESINQLSQTKGIPKEALESIQEIFGGVRGGQVISALNALLPELKKNLTDLGKDPQEFIKGLNNRFNEVKDTVSGQLDIFRNLKTQVGEAFIKGIFGAEDFKESLIKVNMIMEQLIGVSKKLGDSIRYINPIEVFKDADKENKNFINLLNQIDEGRQGLLSLSETVAMINELKFNPQLKGLPIADYIAELQQVATELATNAEMQDRLEKTINEWADKNINKKREEREAVEALSLELQDKLELAQAELSLQDLQIAGADKITLEYQKLDNIVGVLVQRYNNLKDINGETVSAVSEQAVKALVINGNFEKVLQTFNKMKLDEKEINQLATAYVDILKAQYAERQRQVNQVRGLLFQYEQAGAGERGVLQRKIELQAMSPEQVISAYQGSSFDKDLILNMINSFSESVQQSIAQIIARERGIPELSRLLNTTGTNAVIQEKGQPVSIARQIIGAENINVNVNVEGKSPEETTEAIKEQLGKELLKDTDFLNSLAKQISPKV